MKAIEYFYHEAAFASSSEEAASVHNNSVL